MDHPSFRKISQRPLATGRHNFPILAQPDGDKVLFDLEPFLTNENKETYGV